jgi:hypothetical protein
MRWLLLLSYGIVSIAQAAEVVPLRARQSEHGLDVEIKALALPETLRKDLSSGLTNKLLIRITLRAAQVAISERIVEVSVKYDLWDERFSLIVSDGAGLTQRAYSQTDEVLAAIAVLRLRNVFDMQSLRTNQPYTLQVDALLNPIDKERLDKIREWVADNSAYTPGRRGDSGSIAAASAGANAVFNRIFEQYSSGAGLAAAWREMVVSQPFIPASLESEPRSP